MLTKDKLDRILRAPLTKDERLIGIVHNHGGVMTVTELARESGESEKLVCLHVGKSFYLEKEDKLVKLVRRGKESDLVYEVPEMADNIHAFVFSFLCKDYNQTYKGTLERVLIFCQAKKIPYSGYLNNSNIFATYKKEVKKYLTMRGEM